MEKRLMPVLMSRRESIIAHWAPYHYNMAAVRLWHR